jgi:hypothetical protein
MGNASLGEFYEHWVNYDAASAENQSHNEKKQEKVCKKLRPSRRRGGLKEGEKEV